MCLNSGYHLCHRLVGYHRLLRKGLEEGIRVIPASGNNIKLQFHVRKITRAFSGGGSSLASSSSSSSGEEDQKTILQSWTDSVLEKNDNTAKGLSEGQGFISEDKFFKRPSSRYNKETGAAVKVGDPGEGNINRKRDAVSKSGPQPVYRRRMADSTWTKEPIDDKLIWVDCEMTGLDPGSDMIMEIGCIITDSNLKEIASQPSIIIHVPEEKLQGMGVWCVKHHGESGLTDACRQSTTGSEEVDNQLLNFVQKYTKVGECPMAGNSIYMDRLFISKQFPKFHSHFHYRNVDVSTFKELVRRWYPSEYSQAPKKKFAHRVLDDIKDSIAELEYYKYNVMKQKTDADFIASEKQNV